MSSSLSRNTVIAAFAMGWSALTIGALVTPTFAQAQGTQPFYTAELAAPAKETREIAGGVIWYCAGTSCTASKGKSRPVVMCGKLNRELGEIVSFTAKGKVLSQDKLARCND